MSWATGPVGHPCGCQLCRGVMGMNVKHGVERREGAGPAPSSAAGLTPNLLPDPPPVKLLSELTPLTVHEGDDATFRCEVSPPEANVTWLRNGTPVTPGPQLQVAQNGSSHTLTVRGCRLEDAGTVTARAGDTATSARLHVRGLVLWRAKQSCSPIPPPPPPAAAPCSLALLSEKPLGGGQVSSRPCPRSSRLHGSLHSPLPNQRQSCCSCGGCRTCGQRKAKMCASRWRPAEWVQQGPCAGCEAGSLYRSTLAFPWPRMASSTASSSMASCWLTRAPMAVRATTIAPWPGSV